MPPPPHPRLAGTDLVRLALERAPSARQAVDVVTDLISRHGQGGPSEAGGDAGPDGSFLIADAREAYAVEACGPHWALQAINEVRAAGDVCHLRQDWDRISRGLSGLAIERGWWPENGSKLDFAGALAEPGAESAAGLRRWGRATLLLEQQNGQIDTAFLRRLLADHGGAAPALPGRPHFPARAPAAEAPPAGMSLCQHAAGPATAGTAASLIARPGSRPGEIPVAWWSFGVPCTGLYFPLFLEGDLPAAFQAEASGGCQVWRQMMRLQAGRDNLSAVRPALAGLQERFDEQAREFVSEAAVLKEGGAADELRRLAGSFMQHNVEAWTALYEELAEPEGAGGPRDTLSELHYSAAWE